MSTLRSPKDTRDYQYAAGSIKRAYPLTYLVGKPRIKNQGSVGSCVAHALSYIVEEHNNLQEPVSPGFIYGNRRYSLHKGKGMCIRDALKAVQKDGVPLKKLCPQFDVIEVPNIISRFESSYSELSAESYKYAIKTYMRLKKSNLKHFLMTEHSFALCSVKWYSRYSIIDGVIKFDKMSRSSLHALTIVGWNEKGWIIANSWGSTWGNNGYFIYPYNQPFEELWGTTDDINNNVYKKHINKITNPFFDFIYQVQQRFNSSTHA